MKCFICGHDNASINRFCGMCGSILERPRGVTTANVVPIRPQDVAAPVGSAEQPTAAPLSATPPTTSSPTPPAAPVLETPRPELREPAASPRTASTFTLFGETQTMDYQTTTPAGESHTAPSFLGLGDEPASGHYLLDEEEESHGGRNLLLFAVLALVAALAVVQWRSNADVRALGRRAVAAVQDAVSGLNRSATPAPAAKEPTAAEHDDTAKQSPAPASQTPSPTSATDQTSQTTPVKPSRTETGQTNAAGQQPEAVKEGAASPPSSAASEKPQQQAKLERKPGRPEADQNEQKDAVEEPARAKPSAAKAQATRSGDPQAEQLYARAQQSLHGGARNCNTALNSLRSSAERGYARAAAQLGALYATGNCAPFDRVQAYQWFTRAMNADPANRYLRQNRAMLLREMSADERRQVQ